MSTTLANTLYGISFFLSLFVLIGLWWVTVKAPQTRALWGLLALGLTLNWIADLAWGILIFAAPDIWLDWIDYLYIGRYLLVFAAFWLYPRPWGWQNWLGTLASLLAGGLLVWLLIARPAQTPDPDYVWAGMIFPVMDIGILYAVGYRWRTIDLSLRTPFRWLFLAMLAYTAANWFNYSLRVTNPQGDSFAALIFWFLSTVCLGVAAWSFWQRRE